MEQEHKYWTHMQHSSSLLGPLFISHSEVAHKVAGLDPIHQSVSDTTATATAAAASVPPQPQSQPQTSSYPQEDGKEHTAQHPPLS